MLIQAQVAVASLQTKGLSKREAEVLTWVAMGKANSEVGLILNISSRTVSKHLEHIFAKLGVETRTAAASSLFEVIQRSDGEWVVTG